MNTSGDRPRGTDRTLSRMENLHAVILVLLLLTASSPLLPCMSLECSFGTHNMLHLQRTRPRPCRESAHHSTGTSNKGNSSDFKHTKQIASVHNFGDENIIACRIIDAMSVRAHLGQVEGDGQKGVV